MKPYEPSAAVSRYTKTTGLRINTRCKTVGQLKAVLDRLPDKLPIANDCQFPVWFNIGNTMPGDNGEHLGFTEELL